MPRAIPWKQSLVVAAAALMALASLTVSVGLSLRLQSRIAAVQAVTDLRRQLMLNGTVLREAEAAQRMYVITGDDAHLLPLTESRESMPGRWRITRETAAQTDEGLPDLDVLEHESLDALNSLSTTAEIRRRDGREAAIQRVEEGRSYHKLVALHTRIKALLEELDLRIGEQTSSLARAESRGRIAGVATGLVALGIGSLGVWQWRQSLRHYRRELQLSAEKTRAEQMARDKGTFLAAMSHEVRTPLNAILGMSEQLGELLPEGPARQQAETISTAGRSMLRLVNDLLDLSRMEAGRLELHRSAVPVAGELDWVCGLFGPRAAGLGIQLEATAAPDLPPVLWLDEGRFRQIIMNLVGNAVKFTGPGGKVSLRLERAEYSGGGELVLEVKDTGCGISPELQPRIFQPYVQGLSDQRTTAAAGTGLGLAIVRQIVQLMRGTISVQSRPGAGSTFRITLPLLVPPEEFATAVSPATSAATAAPAADSAASPLPTDQRLRLRQVLQNEYPAAVASQSTGDVAALVTALAAAAQPVASPLLDSLASHLRRASTSFSLAELSSLLEQLPRRVAPLLKDPRPSR